MGRRKVELKRIEDKSSRQVTFSKRRSGLIKKASELSVLCDVEVALVIFSNRGRLYEFCSTNSLANILERYQSHLEEDAASKYEAEMYRSESPNMKSHAELLQIVQRLLEEPDAEQLSLTDLIQLEEQLDNALCGIRSRKTQLMLESVTGLQEQQRIMREENELLEKQIADLESNEGDDNNLPAEHNRDASGNVVLGFSSESATIHPNRGAMLQLL